jgi:hypothetical protein
MSPPRESNQPDFTDIRRRADEFARHAYADVFARFERLRSGLDVNLPIVSAIIEREHNGEKEILVQTRWKPERDPLYSGTLEIPAGGMHVYENVYDAVKREVLEETGLRQYLGQLRKAEGRLRSMNTAQAGDLVANLANKIGSGFSGSIFIVSSTYLAPRQSAFRSRTL